MWYLIGLVGLPLVCLLGGAVMLAMIPSKARDYPQCARCKHNLTGLTAPRQCPECGFELFRGGIINAGKNNKRTIMIALGILIMLATPCVGLAMVNAILEAFFRRG